MAGSLIVLLLLSLGLGRALDLASAQDCSLADVVVRQGSAATVYHEEKLAERTVSTTMFVQPGSDFQGVSVEVMANRSEEYAAWFSLDHCYPDGIAWEKMYVEVTTGIFSSGLHFELHTGNCIKKCQIRTRFRPYKSFIKGLSVVARGSSRLRRSSPPVPCLAPEASRRSLSTSYLPQPHCTEQPRLSVLHTRRLTLTTTAMSPSSTTDHPTLPVLSHTPYRTDDTLPTTLVVTMVVLIVVLVVVAHIVVIYRMQLRTAAEANVEKNRREPPEPAPQRSDSVDDSEEHTYYDTWNIAQYPLRNIAQYPVRNEQWGANQNVTNEPVYANIQGEVQNASQNNTNQPLYANIPEEGQNANQDDANEAMYDNFHVTH